MKPAKVSNTGEQDTGGAAPIPRILVVDDDPLICKQLERLYTQSGYTAVTDNSAEAAIERLDKEDIDLVVTDIRLPGLNGVELTQRIQEVSPDVPVIVITGYADIQTAVDLLKLGASDYIVKPFGVAAIQESTREVLKKAQMFMEIRHLRSTLKDRHEFGEMLSRTPEMHRIFEKIRMVSSTDMTVLIEGETGTGKELVASAIHHQSPRRAKPFVILNCSGFPESLLESELFGYERGAFTGAEQSRPGKIELVQGGTLFLDEIESMSLPMQAKLLRVLEDRKVQRLGRSKTTEIDMRVVAASNIRLSNLVAQGQMRNDFYYRINVIPIYLAPLRERKEDIPLLVQDYLRHHPVSIEKRIASISQSAMRELMEYSWPGNIRELQNVLVRAIVLATGRVIEKVDVLEKPPSKETNQKGIASSLSLQSWINIQEREYLIQQLAASGWKMGLAAKNCGVNVKTLYRKIHHYGLHKVGLKSRGETFVLSVSEEPETKQGKTQQEISRGPSFPS